MKKRQIYKQDKAIVFQTGFDKNKRYVTKGIVGATTLFGSFSMILSVAPIQTLAAEHLTDTSTTQLKVEGTGSTKEREQNQVIENPTTPIKSMESTETQNKEDTPTPEGNDQEGNKEDTPTPEGNDQEGNKQDTPTPEGNDQEGNKEDTPTPEVSDQQDSGTEVSTPTGASVQLVENKPMNHENFSQNWSSKFMSQQESTTTNSIKYIKNQSTEAFIQQIGESARKVGQETDLYASVMIAQAILESGAGSSQLSQEPNYNLFGIKGEYEGNSISFKTQEDDGTGTLKTINDQFRSYSNYEESFEDYAKLLKNGISGHSTFYEGVWKTTADTYQEATAFLTGKYATDTQYDQKLNGLIETYQLTTYDHPKEDGTSSSTSNLISATGYMIPVTNYTISSGFGSRGGEFHRGLDFAAPTGTVVSATKAGKVITAETHPSWGNYVVILHEDGSTTLYAHLSEIKASVNQEVTQGQVIGLVGSTGNSTGPHLHFEMCTDASLLQSKLIDPQTILFS